MRQLTAPAPSQHYPQAPARIQPHAALIVPGWQVAAMVLVLLLAAVLITRATMSLSHSRAAAVAESQRIAAQRDAALSALAGAGADRRPQLSDADIDGIAAAIVRDGGAQ